MDSKRLLKHIIIFRATILDINKKALTSSVVSVSAENFDFLI